MKGIFGTSASLWSDLSLLFVVILAGIAIYGAVQGRRRHISTHSSVMAFAALLNWIPVLLLMVPKWANVVSRSESLASGPLVTVPVLHGILGFATQLLMTYTVTRMLWLKQLPPKNPLWLMRITLLLWMLMVIGGIATYVLYVVGL